MRIVTAACLGSYANIINGANSGINFLAPHLHTVKLDFALFALFDDSSFANIG